ncbi:hypothetical protein ABFZ85_03190 [Hyphococcus formosus]|uniref:hypothetical protein n=1 Tax=Hyphococcus formosus TaxID=3143534 RepID=UPI00398BA80B
MSRMDMTTQDLFLRLGTTSISRSTRADALFRRLRDQETAQVNEQLFGAPTKISLNGRQPDQSEQSQD